MNGHMGKNIFKRLISTLLPNRGAEIKPTLVAVDKEAFDRRMLRLFFTRMNSSEAQECFRVMEATPRSRVQLKRIL